MQDRKSGQQPAAEDFSRKLKELEQRSSELKSKIDEQRRAHDMPIDSKLGDPNWEEKAKDGRFDLPDEENE